jgi:dUTPase
MLILPVPKINLIKISSEENLSMTERGEGGFGSSGKW